MNIQWIGTPDFTKGRGGKPLQYIVMHWGVVTNLAQIDAEVANPNREMSYTYALDKDVIHQYVSEDDTAWHAGVFDINQRSIGICIAAGPNYPYADADYESAAQLIADIFRRHGRLEIKGHRDFKATECPGNLDFGRLRARVDEILNPPAQPPQEDLKDARIRELESQLNECSNRPPKIEYQEKIVEKPVDNPEQQKKIDELTVAIQASNSLAEQREQEIEKLNNLLASKEEDIETHKSDAFRLQGELSKIKNGYFLVRKTFIKDILNIFKALITGALKKGKK